MPVCSAGDVIIFTEALTHGAVPWTVEASSRRTLFYKFSPLGISWSAQVSRGQPAAIVVELVLAELI